MLYFIGGVVCQKVITDVRSGAPSYIEDLAGVEVVLTGMPTSLPQFVVSATFGREEKDKQDGHTFRILFETPSGEEVISGPFPLGFKNDSFVSRLNVEIPNFPIKEEGRYFIHVQIEKRKKWTDVSKIPFIVDKIVSEGDK